MTDIAWRDVPEPKTRTTIAIERLRIIAITLRDVSNSLGDIAAELREQETNDPASVVAEALRIGCCISFLYAKPGQENDPEPRQVQVLATREDHIVARDFTSNHPKSFRHDRMRDVELAPWPQLHD